MRQDARTLACLESHFLKHRFRRQRRAIKRTEAAVQIEMIGQQQLPKVGFLRPDDFIKEQFKRSAQIRRGRLIESGKRVRVFGQRARPLHFQPIEEEIPDFGMAARVFQHPLRLSRDLLGARS